MQRTQTQAPADQQAMLDVTIKMLEQLKDVDSKAQTAIDEKGRTLFAKQEYERKSNFWKLCYRAGKETT